jgi:hypothetical protein
MLILTRSAFIIGELQRTAPRHPAWLPRLSLVRSRVSDYSLTKWPAGRVL